MILEAFVQGGLQLGREVWGKFRQAKMKESTFSVRVYWSLAEHSIYVTEKQMKMADTNHGEPLMPRKGTWILLERQWETLKTSELRMG